MLGEFKDIEDSYFIKLFKGRYGDLKPEFVLKIAGRLYHKNIALERTLDFLTCLEACGIGQWEGYEAAQQLYKEEYENESI